MKEDGVRRNKEGRVRGKEGGMRRVEGGGRTDEGGGRTHPPCPLAIYLLSFTLMYRVKMFDEKRNGRFW